MVQSIRNNFVVDCRMTYAAGERGDDVWAEMNKLACGSTGIHVWSFCSPKCPIGNDQKVEKVPGITDVLNIHQSKHRSLNTGCGIDIPKFWSNHAKMGVCDNKGVLVVGGNNHSTESQGPRGGIFVFLPYSGLAEQFRCLFS